MAKGQRQAEPAKRSTRRQAAAPAARREPKASTGAGGAKTAGRPDTAARRAAILDAALTVFAAHGYESARLDDVAAKAGVAKGTLYLYFEDKEALLSASPRHFFMKSTGFPARIGTSTGSSSAVEYPRSIRSAVGCGEPMSRSSIR
jgi:hypothetical protein